MALVYSFVLDSTDDVGVSKKKKKKMMMSQDDDDDLFFFHKVFDWFFRHVSIIQPFTCVGWFWGCLPFVACSFYSVCFHFHADSWVCICMVRHQDDHFLRLLFFFLCLFGNLTKPLPSPYAFIHLPTPSSLPPSVLQLHPSPLWRLLQEAPHRSFALIFHCSIILNLTDSSLLSILTSLSFDSPIRSF